MASTRIRLALSCAQRAQKDPIVSIRRIQQLLQLHKHAFQAVFAILVSNATLFAHLEPTCLAQMEQSQQQMLSVSAAPKLTTAEQV